jgi:multisubunit Na+/H+ antiporter MnhF subunit
MEAGRSVVDKIAAVDMMVLGVCCFLVQCEVLMLYRMLMQ